MLLCNFNREQALERWLSTVANGMRMHKAMVLIFLRRVAESQTEIKFENNIKDFMESEIWQHENSKKLRHWFSKTWLLCHKVLIIWVFMLMQSSFNHLMNQLLQFSNYYRFPAILWKVIYIYIHWVVTLPAFSCWEWKENGNVRMHLTIELQNVFSKRDIIRVKDWKHCISL